MSREENIDFIVDIEPFRVVVRVIRQVGAGVHEGHCLIEVSKEEAPFNDCSFAISFLEAQ